MAIKPTPAAAGHEPRMRLSAVTRGRIERPIRALIFGIEGVGKSSFAANAPSPVFIGESDGTAQLDVARFPEPQSWQDVQDAIDDLATSPHDFRTVVLDTLDSIEPLCWSHVVAKGGPKVETIEDFGYGKGYVAALDEWRLLLSRLERLRNQRGMNVIFVAHSWVKPFKNPEGDDFDRYELKLHAKAGGLMKEWCDAVLFARYETFADKDEKTKRVRGVSTGARVVHTQRTAAYDAKNRYDLPETMPLDWQAFADAVAAHRPADPAKLRERITALLEGADEALKGKVNAAVERAADNAAVLAKIADKLAADVGIKAKENGK